jgi:hypothetical protein
MGEFKAGDRVSTKYYGERVVIGESAEYPGYLVLERAGSDDDRYVALKPQTLTLIPDTVSVDFPRVLAEEMAADPRADDTLKVVRDNPRNTRLTRIDAAVRLAVRQSLGSVAGMAGEDGQ